MIPLQEGERYEFASVHGRFQPPHNGHLEYIMEALNRCNYLYIGITQFRRKRLIQVDLAEAVHRALPQSNPLTFAERLKIIRNLLVSECIGEDRFCVIPFPIEEPEELPDFLPVSVPVLTTTYDAWNQEKIDLLRTAGYQVENLWTRDHKDYEGQEVRRLLVEGNEKWRSLVPASVAADLDELNLADRLLALAIDKPA